MLTINGKVIEEKLVAELPAGAPYLRMVKETIDDKTIFSRYNRCDGDSYRKKKTF